MPITTSVITFFALCCAGAGAEPYKGASDHCLLATSQFLGRRNLASEPPATPDALQVGDAIRLKSHTGNYVGVNGGDVKALRKRQPQHEKFFIEKQAPPSDGDMTIRSGDAIYLWAHDWNHTVTVEGVTVHAKWAHMGSWESLVIMKKGSEGPIFANDVVYLRAHTGKYITVVGRRAEVNEVNAKGKGMRNWMSFVVESDVGTDRPQQGQPATTTTTTTTPKATTTTTTTTTTITTTTTTTTTTTVTTTRDGTDWTQEEALIVMAKLYQVMGDPTAAKTQLLRTNGQYDCHTGFEDTGEAQPCNGKNGNAGTATNDVRPTAAKFVRLGFHDCIKYVDGTGGCDGCLRFYDQFMKYNDLASGNKRNMRRSDPVSGSNNGLAMAADILELIYTSAGFPWGSPTLQPSLKSRGRTRADLWAFAALVATDFAMGENNKACRGEGVCGHLYNEINTTFPCEIKPKRNLRFRTGRPDCPESSKPRPVDGFVKTEVFELPQGHKYRAYETEKDEDQPNPSGNSAMLADYMKRVFDFDKKETVAIMGAHSLGEMHGEVALFKYDWQRNQVNFLNNNFYRMIAAMPSKYIASCHPFRASGGPNGALAETQFLVRPIRKSESAGPYFWFHAYRRCPDCIKNEKDEWVNVDQRGSGKFRSAACCMCHEKPKEEIPEECVQQVTRDETMLPTDISVISKFEVDEHGVPSGCPGFPSQWNRANIVEQAKGEGKHGINFYNVEPKCPDNDLRDCPTCPTMAGIARRYANKQNEWADDFYDAWEKC
jgi:hypothetical protein